MEIKKVSSARELNDLVANIVGPGGMVVFPQFERTDGILPVCPEGGIEWFTRLQALPHETLIAIGLGLWEPGHYLYPAEWYDFIPDGMPIVSINGKTRTFKYGETDNDQRFGMLAFGFKREAEE